MDLTISSVFTTSLFTSVLILFFCFCFHRDRVVRSVGPDCMIVVLLAAMLRMCIPFEFYCRGIIRERKNGLFGVPEGYCFASGRQGFCFWAVF